MTQVPDIFLLLTLIFILYHDRQIYHEYHRQRLSMTDSVSNEQKKCLKIIKKTKYLLTKKNVFANCEALNEENCEENFRK